MIIAARQSMMTGKRLPYDAEIEYLESTGTQYIDTGLQSHSNIGYRIDGMLLSTSTEAFPVLIGIQDRNDMWYYEVYGSFSDTNPRLVNEGWEADDVYSVSGYPNRRTVATFNYLGDGLASINPSQYVLSADEINWQEFTDYDINICIFAAGSDNQEGYIYRSNSRVYSCQMSDGNAIVRDFIPVRIGNVGCLYDRYGVGGMNTDGTPRNDGLYFNRGTGSFILGPDK